jgi:tetratricopeptide (TPR) repeat protein
MRIKRLIAICFFLVTVRAVTANAQSDLVSADVALWSAEVYRHVPGTADEPAKRLAQWEWVRLLSILHRFFGNGGMPDDVTLLLKAIVAYGDIALFIPREQRPVYPGLYKGDDRVTLTNDGAVVGGTWRDTHIRIAHEIVRRVVRSAKATDEHKEFAATWYAAIAASLARLRDLAGLKDHLEEAREQFPRNADIQFLSGCWAESIASAAVQTALPHNEKRPSQMKLRDLHSQNVLTPRANLANAENLYRRALEIDRHHYEARIRLGRVLMLSDAVEKALPLLEPAPPTTEPVLLYYRLLFLSRAYERTGKIGAARASLDAASRLFPAAPSPWLGLSALAALDGDAETARAELERAVSVTDARADPWWVYDDCSGRDGKRIYEDFIQRVRQSSAFHPAGESR